MAVGASVPDGARPPDAVSSGASPHYDDVAADELARRIGVPGLDVYDEVGSTMDVAHEAGARGVPAGWVTVAAAQTSGRGRQGRRWRSSPGAGVWATVIERPSDASGLEVLSLRIGLALASRLERWAAMPVGLKWPNDLFLGARKLAGILVEARWRGARMEWLAVGVGVNVRGDAWEHGASLRDGTRRAEVLGAVVDAVRSAVAMHGPLTHEELASYQRRDVAAGRRVVAPSGGVVTGVGVDGAVLILGTDGMRAHRAGSLVFAEDA